MMNTIVFVLKQDEPDLVAELRKEGFSVLRESLLQFSTINKTYIYVMYTDDTYSKMEEICNKHNAKIGISFRGDKV